MFKVDITITNPDGQTTKLTGAFTVVQAPQVDGISPSFGPASGGSQHVITGSGFLPGATVLFGDRPAEIVSLSEDGKSLTVIAPALG